jgi:ankyrin repeat protein
VDAARLLLASGADVNALSTNEHVQTAAIHAASAAQGVDEATRYALVALALEYGADPDLPQGGGFRAIDAARQNGDKRVEQLLLDNGATP